MTKKINRIFLTIIMVLFVLNLMVALFLLTNTVKAQSGVTQCEIDKTTQNPICPPLGKIRVQVPIPGISDACKYTDSNDVVIVNGQTKAVEKTCYWVDSLPFYVQKFYNFSIGIIAIIAVLMIMIGGLRWIFAAGNVGSVSEAKATIYAAITGLVLALTSYVILYNINPRLVNLSLPGVTPVKRIEQQNFWCAQYFYPTPIAGITVSGLNSTSVSGDKAGDCGVTYKVEVQAGQNVAITSPTCYGNMCATGACFIDSGIPYCADPKEVCKSTNKNSCFSVNDTTVSIKNTSDNSKILQSSCMMRVDDLIIDALNPDECTWDRRIYCPSGTTRVSCLEGPQRSSGHWTNEGCWKVSGGKNTPFIQDVGDYGLYCTDDKNANSGANYVCCSNVNASGTKEYKLYGSDYWNVSNGVVYAGAYLPDCSNINRCDAVGREADGRYESEDAKINDPCHVCSN